MKMAILFITLKNQFEDVWSDAELLTEKWIENYELEYEKNADKRLAGQVIEMPGNYYAQCNRGVFENCPK